MFVLRSNFYTCNSVQTRRAHLATWLRIYIYDGGYRLLKAEINYRLMPFYASCKEKKFLEQFNSAQGTRFLSKSHPLTGKGASLQGVWTEKYAAPCFLFIVIQAVNSLIPNATRHAHSLLFERPDLCFIWKSPARWKRKKKKKKRGRERGKWERNTQQKHFFPQHLLYEAGGGECGKEGFLRNFPVGRKKSVSFGNACTFTH